MQTIRKMLTKLGEVAAHPGAFGVLIVYALLWFIFDRNTLDWHAVTTLIVWFMTLLIQRAEHRDTQALQAKLDELLHAQRGADNSLTKIDEKSPKTSNAIARRLALSTEITSVRAANFGECFFSRLTELRGGMNGSALGVTGRP